MAGTVAYYQGFPCADVRFRRTRGWTADTTTLLFFASDFPEGFEFVVPSPGDLDVVRTVVQPDLGPLHKRGLLRPAPRSRRLEFSGALVLAEVDERGRPFVVAVDPLFVVGLETVRRNQDGSVAVVRARLVDARYFFARGFVRRWSFNRAMADGVHGKDSLKPDGQRFTLAEVAAEVAACMFGAPKLAQVPESWRDARPGVELPPFSPATAGLVRLAQDHGAGELSLNLDGTIALHAPGEGRVGHCPQGKGASNPADLPRELFLDLQGTGQTRGVEATYPPDFLVVVGGLRVATVRLDDLDPVLVIEGIPFPLDERTVRKLTGGKYGLAWLRKFVLAPQAYQNDVALDPRVVRLLREQAYRLWRIPGVEKELSLDEPLVVGPAPFEVKPWLPFEDQPLPGFEDLMAGRRQAAKDEPFRVRGPNAHLLPLLERAETVAGRRLPVRVDAYRFASVHREMAPTKEGQQLATARQRMAQLKFEIQQLARARQKPDPWSGVEWFVGFDDEHISRRAIETLTPLLRDTDASFEELNRAIERVRLIDRIREVSPREAAQYSTDLSELLQAEERLGGHGKALHDMAKTIVEFEKEVAQSRDYLERPDDEALERAQELQDRVAGHVRELERLRQERQRRTQTGARAAPTPQTAVFVRNLSRQLDPGARVYSADLGILQTTELSGHVLEEGVPVAEATSLVPLSPLVTFGAVLRPRLDVAPGRVLTGESPTKSGTKVPSVLSDRESFYTAAFRRTGLGQAEQIALDAVPLGQGVPLERPDLVELVPLDGESNKAALDETAAAIARDQFRRPDKVEARKLTVGRPWPVNTDGVVAGVEIAMRPNGKGFVTTIYTGSEAPLPAAPLRTRVRVRRGQPSDAAARNGALP